MLHPTPRHTTHYAHYKKLTTTVSCKTRGNVGGPLPPHQGSQRRHGPTHREAARVQTTHQSSQSRVTPNVAALKCQ